MTIIVKKSLRTGVYTRGLVHDLRAEASEAVVSLGFAGQAVLAALGTFQDLILGFLEETRGAGFSASVVHQNFLIGARRAEGILLGTGEAGVVARLTHLEPVHGFFKEALRAFCRAGILMQHLRGRAGGALGAHARAGVTINMTSEATRVGGAIGARGAG